MTAGIGGSGVSLLLSGVEVETGVLLFVGIGVAVVPGSLGGAEGFGVFVMLGAVIVGSVALLPEVAEAV